MAVRHLRDITIELDAGNAAMIDLGKMLGPYGVPPHDVKRRYDELTQAHHGEVIPAVVSIFDDRTWTMRLKTPPTSFLIRRAAGVAKGSSAPGTVPGGLLRQADLRTIALRKLPDLNTDDLDAAMRQIAGTARSMGVKIVD